MACPQDRSIDQTFWVGTAQVTKSTLVGPIFARRLKQNLVLECAQTLQTARPCLTPTESKVWARCVFASAYHLAATKRATIRRWSTFRVSRPNRRSQNFSHRPQTMLTDFQYVWGSGLHLWQAPRTAQSTHHFGVWGVTCTTCPKTGGRKTCPSGPKPCAPAFNTLW